MVTLNRALAPRQLSLASESFTAMNRTFVTFLDVERHGSKSEIYTSIRHGETSTVIIALAGGAAAVLLVALSFVLARFLARALEAQITALTELGTQAGARVAIEGGQVDRIAQG